MRPSGEGHHFEQNAILLESGGEMNVWIGEDGHFKCTIKEKFDGYFDLIIVDRFSNFKDWFPSYKSARNFLKREYAFTGRMKKVS